jgi:hypothetical protein
MNKSQNRFLSALFIAAVGFAQAQDVSDVEFKRVSISGQFDNGQIVHGETNRYDIYGKKTLNGAFFQRTGVWITQEAVVKERLRLIMGVGGVFWYALPENPNNVSTRQTQFGPGISQAQGIYTFGDLADPTVSLQMGFFPYKYNSDAKNLGEYLMRSGTYPGYLVTGGWNMLNSAGYMVQGARLNVNLWDGKFQSDLLLAMEHDLPPLFSVTPAYIATVKPVPGIQIGAGAACNHCLSVKPSRESPEIPENQIITGVSYDSVSQFYTYTRDSTAYYTFQGIKLTATLSVDPKAYIPMPFLGAEDLKIYSEVALLGVKNYGYMYEDPLERMPVMVGFNIPTFKLLDVLSLEVEHYDSKFLNNYKNPLWGSVPMWFPPGIDGQSVEPAWVVENDSKVRRDNWKWSLYGKKEVTKGINIYAQAASDHIRTIGADFGAPSPTYVPITNRNGKDWYYIIRLDFGI